MSHDEFYTDLIQEWKSGGKNGTEGGWAGLYHGVFNKAVKDNNFKKVAEVGIGYGFHAKYILDGTNVDKLYLVDPMKWYPNDAFATDVMKYGGFEKLVKILEKVTESLALNTISGVDIDREYAIENDKPKYEFDILDKTTTREIELEIRLIANV